MTDFLENDIDLLEDNQFVDPFYLCIRLVSLMKNKKKSKCKKGSHFKFLLEQGTHFILQSTDNQIIDQTPVIQDSFWIMKTPSISLNKESLHFIVPDPDKSNTQFDLKMYKSSQDSVQQLGTLNINSLTYIELFLQEGKRIFHEMIALCPEYTLEYQIYIQKTKIQLDNLLISKQNDTLRYAFKKKTSEFIEINNENNEIVRKNSFPSSQQILRKSLQINSKILKNTKKLKIQRLNSKSNSSHKSKSSFLAKLGDILTQGFSSKKVQFKCRQSLDSDEQKSITFQPPLIGPHKYNRPQNKFYYHRINIERQKQLQRVQKDLKKNKIQQENSFYGLKMMRNIKIVGIFILVMMIVLLILNSGKKFKNYRWIKGLVELKF